MRWLFYVLLGWACAALVTGQEAEEEIEPVLEVILPQWSDEEQAELERGVLIPGSSIMGSVAFERLFSGGGEPIEFEPELIEVPEEEVEEWPTTIDDRYFLSYFGQPPAVYFIDPQHLLTDQERRDREGFLAYHARDSGIDIYFYLFDAKQELPAGESAEQVMQEHLEGRGHCVAVFYYLGIPERTQIAVSSEIAQTIPLEVRRNALVRSVEEALDRTEAVAQIESFSVQLSIRLYWMEKELTDIEIPETGVLYPLEADEEEVKVESAYSWSALYSSGRVRMVAGGIAIFVLTGIVAIFGRWLADRKRIYIFPESEGNLLLEAPHAAGVGAVIAYDSPSLPPAVQRDEVPDYLQRM